MQLHYFAGGHLGQYEDWWYLVTNEGQEAYIEHEWTHFRANGGGSGKGSERLSITCAQKEMPETARHKLAELLK
jgi:hypothetical protein